MGNQIQINDQETNQVITINDPNFYGPAISTQDNAYTDTSCSIQIGTQNPNNITFNLIPFFSPFFEFNTTCSMIYENMSKSSFF